MTEKELLTYVNAHLADPLTVKQLADMAGYSVSGFLREFQKAKGMSCMSYVRRQRLLAATRDIIAGDRIIDAALRYGYESHSAYSKAFRKYFGCTPSVLRAVSLSIRFMEGKNMDNQIIGALKVGTSKEELLQILQFSVKRNPAVYSAHSRGEIWRNRAGR